MIVVLEDIHAADDATLRLLVHVASIARPGLLLVATLRRHEASALIGTLSALSRPGARRLGLDGLATEEVRVLVRELSGRDPGGDKAEQLRSRTVGNPFFLTELGRCDSLDGHTAVQRALASPNPGLARSMSIAPVMRERPMMHCWCVTVSRM